MPTAKSDTATTSLATPVVIPVLSNDQATSGRLSIASLTQPANGRVSLNADNTLTYQPSETFTGVDVFGYGIVDGTGAVSTTTVTVTVSGSSGPMVTNDSAETEADTPVTIAILANDKPAGKLSIAQVGRPAHGSVGFGANQSLVYTPDAGFTGDDSFTYVAMTADGKSGQGVVTVRVTAKTKTPTARADTASTTAGTPVVIPVLANDIEPGGLPLSVAALSAPTQGSITLNADQTITYTPDAGYVGQDSFSYTCASPSGLRSTTTVTVTVRAGSGLPVLRDDTASTREGEPVTIHVLGNDAATSGTLSIIGLSTPANGSLRLNADQSITYTPKAGFAGQDSFRYQAANSVGQGSATVRIEVTATQSVPVARADSKSTDMDTPVTITVLANDSDPGGGVLDVLALGTPAKGKATLNPDKTVTYAPNAGFVGVDSFTYVIGNGGAHTATGTVTVTVQDPGPAPVAADDYAETYNGVPIEIMVLGNDSGADLVVTKVGGPSNGTAAVIGNRRRIRYTPSSSYVGRDSFSYEVSNGRRTATGTIRVDVRSRGYAFSDGTFFSDQTGWV
ncbi:Ig-like domain-containing protein [Marinivivus vitaminiproducens]|uniref:Ig-like domain-containing protein n=1 Tax=Marinivivus vitaminiproducens TaxID=3035935 RepID=UPI0027A1177E|nr:Ig-like domain-containing protein [Geminicoccaceae bacterium SCSIO 64248]